MISGYSSGSQPGNSGLLVMHDSGSVCPCSKSRLYRIPETYEGFSQFNANMLAGVKNIINGFRDPKHEKKKKNSGPTDPDHIRDDTLVPYI